MKVTYEFIDEDESPDIQKRRLMDASWDLYQNLWDVDDYCRGKIKYDDDLTNREHKMMEEIREICNRLPLSDLVE